LRACTISPDHSACAGQWGAQFSGPTLNYGLEGSWSKGAQTLLGGGGAIAGVIFPNQLLKRWPLEQAEMEAAGVQRRPVSPGQPGFDEVIRSNEPIKWASMPGCAIFALPEMTLICNAARCVTS
jgi:hypothetical protein